MLTICYITSRKEPHSRWFFESLLRETNGNFDGINIIMVDFHAPVDRITELFGYKDVCGITGMVEMTRTRVQPKPCVWQGQHRLTKQDWFAASNARNTALCLAEDGWIAYVDDLSVLMPGWLNCVREAMAGNYIVCGAYRKVNKLVIENGLVKSFDENSNNGIDSRISYVNSDVTPCEAGWLFGCSMAAPVEALLTANGWPEDLCDGMGFEDCCMGIVLKNAGFGLRYDRRMMTYESDELHFAEPAFRKEDWHFENGKPVLGGNGRDDKSHAALNIALQSKLFPNHFDIRTRRELALNGQPFPIDQVPEHEWYTGQQLSSL